MKMSTIKKLRNKSGIGRKQDSDAQLSSIENPDDNESATDISTRYNKPIVSGYLFKRGRHGKWQRRWFESDGKRLLYFKSEVRRKILATLDLLHVGSVAMDDTDPADCSFVIEVAGRKYYLCADSKDHATDWVISMNRVREARMEIGNLKLIEPRQEDDITPRVVMVAPRKRAKGLGIEDFNEDIEENSNNVSGVSGFTEALSPGSGMESVDSSNISSRNEAIGAGEQRPNRRQRVLGRWRKRRPSYQNWMRRLSRWARRIKSVRCVVREDFQHLGSFTRRKHASENTKKSPIVDATNSISQVKNDGDSTGRTPSKVCFVTPLHLTKSAHFTDLDPEVRGSLNFEQIHISGQSSNQISKGNATISETPNSQVNDEVYTVNDKVYTAFEQKTKISTTTWGMASQSRALREKMEEASSRENSANGDVDSSSGRESSTTTEDEASVSGVV